MAHTYTNLLVHAVFSTKDRAPLLDAELRGRLFPYMGGIVRQLEGTAILINGVADHVHLLLAVPPTLAVSDLMRGVKANSSKSVGETLPEHRGFAWQAGYSAFSVSHSTRPQVEKYIAGQEAHHRRMTFKEELVAFLQRHQVPYDERYIWE